MAFWYYREHYTPAVPRQVKGGIKAQTKRGNFAQSWWAKRWIEVLESFHIGARLERGRFYARRGQVVSIDIGEGSIVAAVQGTRAAPYKVAISVKTLSSAEWRKIVKALSRQAIFAAKLLAGEMPDDIEVVFKEQKLSLFPGKLDDLETNCSCPDWSNPCKHIAAVYYLLGEEFDRDPFVVFKLRGLDRDKLVRRLAESAGDRGDEESEKKGSEHEEVEPESVSASEPLPADPDLFWRSTGQDPIEQKKVLIPQLSAAFVKRLGNFPLWRGTEPFAESLEHIYSGASFLGLSVYLGEGRD